MWVKWHDLIYSLTKSLLKGAVNKKSGGIGSDEKQEMSQAFGVGRAWEHGEKLSEPVLAPSLLKVSGVFSCKLFMTFKA